jgi:hypothetical protein
MCYDFEKIGVGHKKGKLLSLVNFITLLEHVYYALKNSIENASLKN